MFVRKSVNNCLKWRLQWRNTDTHSICNSEGYACSKGTIYEDVFIYIKFYISMSRVDYICQDTHTRKTRFQYTYQDLRTRINIRSYIKSNKYWSTYNYRISRTDIKICIYASWSSHTPRASRSHPGGLQFDSAKFRVLSFLLFFLFLFSLKLH